MSTEQEMQRIKQRIAEVYARREGLKQSLDSGALAPRIGFARLDTIDRELSDLDTRFKILWDAAHVRSSVHPAGLWARETVFTPSDRDCVVAVMLKMLDGKCKMAAADRLALIAVYDALREHPGERFGEEAHELIAAARRGEAEAEQVHAWRVRAEAAIPKPTMKAFKQFIGAVMPRAEGEVSHELS